MDSPEVTFTLAYLVFAVCFVFTPTEFHSAGLTVQNLLSGWLGSEDAAFVPYHLRRTAATLLCHSLLPLGEPGADLRNPEREGRGRGPVLESRGCQGSARVLGEVLPLAGTRRRGELRTLGKGVLCSLGQVVSWLSADRSGMS